MSDGLVSRIFAYDSRGKWYRGLFFSVCAGLLALGVAFLFLFWGPVVKDSWFGTLINSAVSEMWSGSFAGLFLVGLFGGLFFLSLPVEVIFYKSIGEQNPFFALIFLSAGLLISYSADYLLGAKMAGISKKLISIKQFYRVKTYVNRWGKLVIFVFHLVGFLSQPVTFIVGVFRYNPKRLFLLAVTAQLLKYAALISAYSLGLQI